MGAGASLPEQASLPPTIDKPMARSVAGEHFDEAAFDAEAVNGVVARESFLQRFAALQIAEKPVVVEYTSAHTSESLIQCRSFLLGSHARVGADSYVRKLPPDLLRRICTHVLQPLKCAEWHLCGTCATFGRVDLWLFVGDPEPATVKKKKATKKKKKKKVEEEDFSPEDSDLRAVLQQQLPDASTATRYLGWSNSNGLASCGKCCWDDRTFGSTKVAPLVFDWTQVASDLDPHRNPAAAPRGMGTNIKTIAPWPDEDVRLREVAAVTPSAAASSSRSRHSASAAPWKVSGRVWGGRVVGVCPDGVRFMCGGMESLQLSREILLAPAADNQRSMASLFDEYCGWNMDAEEE